MYWLHVSPRLQEEKSRLNSRFKQLHCAALRRARVRVMLSKWVCFGENLKCCIPGLQRHGAMCVLNHFKAKCWYLLISRASLCFQLLQTLIAESMVSDSGAWCRHFTWKMFKRWLLFGFSDHNLARFHKMSEGLAVDQINFESFVKILTMIRCTILPHDRALCLDVPANGFDNTHQSDLKYV